MEEIFHRGKGALRPLRIMSNGEFGPADNHLGIHPLGLAPTLHVVNVHDAPVVTGLLVDGVLF